MTASAARVLDGADHTITVTQAAKALGISRGLAYELIGRDEFPVRVLRLGARYRIPVAPLRRLLEENGEQ